MLPPVVRTKEEWAAVVAACRKSYDPRGVRCIAYDTETVDRRWPNIQLVGFSLGWFEEDGTISGAYVPIGHTTPDIQLPIADVLPDLKDLLTDATIELVAHNAKYDIQVSKLLPNGGVKCHETLFDTLVVAYLLNTNGVGSPSQVLEGHGSLGLKDLSKHLLGYEMTELASLAKFEWEDLGDGERQKVLRVDQVPVDKLGDYAADDVIQTLKLRELFLPQLLADTKLTKLYYGVERPFVHVLADLEETGIELDVAFLRKLRSSIDVELVTLQRQAFEERPGEDFPSISDAALVAKVAAQYDDLDALYLLDPTDPRYPRNAKGGPAGKGWARKQLQQASGLGDHTALWEKIRDDGMRPLLRAYPDLSHKVCKLGSPQVLNRVLFDECYLDPIGERGDNGYYSTDATNLGVYAKSGNTFAKSLLRYRELTKVHGTYLVGMVTLLSEDGRIRTRSSRTGTRTGRLSSSDPNLQNIPTSKEFPIRAAFVARGVSRAKITLSTSLLTP